MIQASTETDLEDAAVARKHLDGKQPKDSDRELVARLVGQARRGRGTGGRNGLLGQLTKLLLESALEGEIIDHLGPVEISVPRDRDASFEPKIVRKRQRRLFGVDKMVISLAAKGLTTGEISAHLAEAYGA